MRCVGTTSRGIRMPVFKTGDDLPKLVVDNLLLAAKEEGFSFHDKDVVAVTESVVARTEGNYASIEQIAKDVKAKTGGDTVGVVFPILSRNRFSILLKGIAKGVKKVVIVFSYPSDEVGNALFKDEALYNSGVNPYTDVLSEEKYREVFGYVKHEFTGVDYVSYYRELVEGQGAECQIIFANHAEAVLKYTDVVISADIHSRFKNKKILKDNGAKIVLGLDDILTSPVDGSGFNPQYGLLGTNKSTEETVKLFPRGGQAVVDKIHDLLFAATGKNIEVMVYGDGAFKDPQGKIWELADPVVSPAHTEGLKGTPNELKLKYLADNQYKGLAGDKLKEAIKEEISHKKGSLVGNMASQGTTPRQLTDLLGSLCDLTSGSGDKGTPVILVQGYFDNYSND